jgi:hypothetical protein
MLGQSIHRDAQLIALKRGPVQVRRAADLDDNGLRAAQVGLIAGAL